MTRLRIEALPGRTDEITCALVFAPVAHSPAKPLLLIQRPDAQDGVLGPRGWAVASNGLRPRLVEQRGDELWLMFGSELSWHVQRGTPIAVREKQPDGLSGRAIWPAIARGRPPAMPDAEEQEDDRTVIRQAPPPVVVAAVALSPPIIPVVAPSSPVIRAPDQKRASGGAPWLLPGLLLLLLLACGGGAYWWWFLREPAPPPPITPAIVAPATPGDPCLDLATVLTPACPRERLATLAPTVQLRLAEGLLRMEGRPAQGLALSLLVSAANAHGPAQMALARLYDPANFQPGSAVSAANPARALDLYRDAATAGVSGAAPARVALVDRLRREAAGQGAEADRARLVLRQAGIE